MPILGIGQWMLWRRLRSQEGAPDWPGGAGRYGLPSVNARLLSRRAGRALFRERRRTGSAAGGQMAWTRAAAVAEVKERCGMDADVGGEEIALYWVDDAT